MVAFTSCNAFIRQLTHGLGGGVAPNSLHRVAQSFARVQKAARELSRAAFETNCRVPPGSIRHWIDNE